MLLVSFAAHGRFTPAILGPFGSQRFRQTDGFLEGCRSELAAALGHANRPASPAVVSLPQSPHPGVTGVGGASQATGSGERLGYRNGYRHRTLTTQVGDLDLIPKLRAGSFLPSILEPRRRGERALTAVIIEAYISGVSTRLSGRRPACRKH